MVSPMAAPTQRFLLVLVVAGFKIYHQIKDKQFRRKAELARIDSGIVRVSSKNVIPDVRDLPKEFFKI